MWQVSNLTETTYGERYPYLLQIGLERIDWGLFPTRAARRLQWYGCMIWRNIAGLNDSTLLEIHHLGETTVAEVHRILDGLELARKAASEEAPSNEEAGPSRLTERNTHFFYDLGDTAVDWRLFPDTSS